jgi:uncharacterized protein YbaA (DUF1428 family)
LRDLVSASGHSREGHPYPDKATRDAANERMSADPETMEMEMPFEGSRMFWGGFQPVLDE